MFAIGNSKWDRYNAILKYLYCIAVSFELVTDSLVHSRKGQEREIIDRYDDELECKFVAATSGIKAGRPAFFAHKKFLSYFVR